MNDIRVQEAPIDVAVELDRVLALGFGAVVNFVGQVRAQENERAIDGLHLEHYPGMTQRALERITLEAKARWPLKHVTLLHRYGNIQVGEPIVLVITGSDHRLAAFDACHFLIDFLKTDAPFWKKTLTQEGGQWVEAKNSDDLAKKRWESS